MTQANISGPAQHTATWTHSARVFRAMLPALSLVGVIWSMSTGDISHWSKEMARDSGIVFVVQNEGPLRTDDDDDANVREWVDSGRVKLIEY